MAILAVVLFTLLMVDLVVRKPGPGSLIFTAFLPALAVITLVLGACWLMLWGATVETRTTVEVLGRELDAESMHDTASNLGVGMITGLVAGAVLGLSQRWHDFESTVDWNEYLKQRLRRKGYKVVELDGSDDSES
jgi:hypothetical protein